MTYYLLVLRTADLPKPYVPSYRANCRNCLAEVWVSKNSPGNLPIICVDCAVERIHELEAGLAAWKGSYSGLLEMKRNIEAKEMEQRKRADLGWERVEELAKKLGDAKAREREAD